jgi:hypothetical protein
MIGLRAVMLPTSKLNRRAFRRKLLVKIRAAQKVAAQLTHQLAAAVLQSRGAVRAVDAVMLWFAGQIV